MTQAEAIYHIDCVGAHFRSSWPRAILAGLGALCGAAMLFGIMDWLKRETGTYPSAPVGLALMLIPFALFWGVQRLGPWLDARANTMATDLPDRWPSWWRIDVGEDGVLCAHELGSSQLSWPAVKGFYRFPESYVVIGMGGPVYIPRPAFDDDNDAEGFLADVLEWIPQDAETFIH